jgi:hypothetical protein
VQLELLPEHEWRLLTFQMRFDFLDAVDKIVVVRKWSTEIEYKPGSTLPPYRVTVEEDTDRGLFKIVRQFRSLTETEKASLKELCYLSGYQLPEPEGLPQDSQWWQYLIGFTACGILFFFGLRWYRSRSISS